ncbi:hypothetical protein [uncultured Clostridium sp.]|uniref:hypothetical protein n=1 Tax=uncultured Clostridium sp. TaxID=59620 RepID=UPI0025F39F15|nr:hypothetical protein [uncultured Clostridium sp.]
MITLLTYYIAEHFFERYYGDKDKDYFINTFMIETFVELGILLMNILGPAK